MNKKMILPLLTVFLFSSCHKAENETLFTESIPDTESIARTTTAESSISVPGPSETVRSHDHHFKWWFEISPIRALLQARPKGRISQANYRLPLKEVIYAYLLPVRQYTS